MTAGDRKTGTATLARDWKAVLPGYLRTGRASVSCATISWVAASLVAFACIRPAIAGQDPLSSDVTACEGPASTPACASKTWSDCFWRRDPTLCAAVGRPEIKFWSTEHSDDPKQIILTEKPVDPEPIENPDRALTLGVRAVQGRRFDWILARSERDSVEYRQHRPCLTPPSRRGTHEVLHGWHAGQDDKKVDDAYSNFFRKEGDRWVLTAWTWWHHEHLCEWNLHLSPECETLIYVIPWDKWHAGR